MTGPRQTSIIPIVPGEPINQTLLNQLADGADHARNVTGDGKIQVTQIGGNIGLSLARQAKSDKNYLVQITPGGTLGTGWYYGKLYLQPVVDFTPGGTTPDPMPDTTDCVIVNLAETDGGASPITDTRPAFGRMISAYQNMPIIAVDVEGSSGSSNLLFSFTGTSSTSTTLTNALTAYALNQNFVLPSESTGVVHLSAGGNIDNLNVATRSCFIQFNLGCNGTTGLLLGLSAYIIVRDTPVAWRLEADITRCNSTQNANISAQLIVDRSLTGAAVLYAEFGVIQPATSTIEKLTATETELKVNALAGGTLNITALTQYVAGVTVDVRSMVANKIS